MQRGDHTAILSPPFFGIKINHCLSPNSFSIVGREYYLEDLMDLEEPMI